ncbi:uroporphyrinogen-III synthase [Litoreibacter meonggei]|uniref:Uroporphyrinogen-III synthase n=1 Tax=Litoreibacter meonggei TaxID=1049199 RepID=A0A497VQP3_9RHOB|nr:uroporphyrinogen-III synthase [Litoreibacter meonggei]RLJ41264.1 uroporphyrinogen-III synthase [Litoreibacter meonggei]
MTQTIPATVLLTRPKAAGERFAADLAAPVILSPLMETVFLDFEPLEQAPDAMVFTSENGVRGFVRGSEWRGRAFCVGDRTAQEARDAGFDAESADGDLRDLNTLLADRAQGMRLAHARGRHVAGDVDMGAVPLTVYEQRAVPLSDEARAALGRAHKLIVPLFSPRSAALFAKQLTGKEIATLDVIVISDSAAKVAQDAGLHVARVADAPDAVAMLHAIERARD